MAFYLRSKGPLNHMSICGLSQAHGDAYVSRHHAVESPAEFISAGMIRGNQLRCKASQSVKHLGISQSSCLAPNYKLLYLGTPNCITEVFFIEYLLKLFPIHHSHIPPLHNHASLNASIVPQHVACISHPVITLNPHEVKGSGNEIQPLLSLKWVGAISKVGGCCFLNLS